LCEFLAVLETRARGLGSPGEAYLPGQVISTVGILRIHLSAKYVDNRWPCDIYITAVPKMALAEYRRLEEDI
jgi:hypothetical protein